MRAFTVKQARNITIGISLAIPAVVVLLYYMPKTWAQGVDLGFLPLLNACINGTTFMLLLLALRAIKNGKRNLHQRLMWTNLGLSVAFLLSYVAYHSTAESTPYGGEGALRYIYYFVLLTHILLSAIIVPLVLVTLFRALSERFDKHKKIAKITFPLWLYVTFTGVLVYILISPYY